MSDEKETPTPLDNPRQVHLYLQEQGWKCAYNTVAKDIKSGKLTARRGGGFARQTVDQYAMTHLVRRVDADPAKNAPWTEPDNATEVGAQEERIRADTDLKRTEAQRKKFLYERERGKYTPTSIIGRELAERWHVVRMRLSSFGRELAGEICDMFGGGPDAARAVVRAASGDDAALDAVQRFALSRREELAALFRVRSKEVLSAFADDTWMTEDMAAAWEKYERERTTLDTATLRELIRAAGGDETRAAELAVRYRVQEIAE